METTVQNFQPLEKDQLANRATARSFYKQTANEAYDIPYQKVTPRDGFNDREDWGDIEELVDQIVLFGQINDIAGDILEDGTVLLSRGNRRLKAFHIINERGIPGFETIRLKVNPRSYSDTDRLLVDLTDNQSAKNFTPIEEANRYAKLIGRKTSDGKTIRAADIAKITGKSKMHVSNRLQLAGISEEEKEAVNNGTISATAMTDMVKSGKTEEERKEIISSAQEDGEKVKVTDVAKEKPKGKTLGEALDELLTDKPIEEDEEEIFKKEPDNDDQTKPSAISPNDAFDDQSSAEADHQEAQTNGLFSTSKAKSPTLVTMLVECSLMTGSIEHFASQIEGQPEVSEGLINAMKKLKAHIQNAKKMAEALR